MGKITGSTKIIAYALAMLILAMPAGCGNSGAGNLQQGSFKLTAHPETYIAPAEGTAFSEIASPAVFRVPLKDKFAGIFRLGITPFWNQPVSFNVDLPSNAVLAFEWGFSADAASMAGKDFTFRVAAEQDGWSSTLLNVQGKVTPVEEESALKLESIYLDEMKPGKALITFSLETSADKLPQRLFNIASPRIYSEGRADYRRVILIGVDTLRADHLGCYGYSRATSPQLDSWAADATRYSYCISASPWTFPSFSAMLTGRYPSRCGATTNVRYLPDVETTLAEILGRDGFLTYMVVNNIYTGPPVNLHQGFDSALRFPVERADTTFDAAKKWLASHKSEDTFAFIHFMDPHVPYHPPMPFNDMFDPGYSGRFMDEFKEVDEVRRGEIVLSPEEIAHLKALYDGEIAYFDDEFGKFIQFLQDEGMYDDTLLIFTADHGEEFYEHGGFEHGHSLYDEMIHVPLIISGPGIDASSVDDRIASTLDILPGVLEYYGIHLPRELNGNSLFKPLPDVGRMLIAEQLRYGAELKGVTTPEYRYIYNTLSGEDELYNLADDPAMLHSVASDRKATARSFRAFVTSYTISTGAPWHVNFQNSGNINLPATYRGTISCAGGFARIDQTHFEQADSLTVNGEKMEFNIRVNPASDKEIAFVTNDDSADVSFEMLFSDSSLPGGYVFIGPAMRQTSEPAFTLNPNDEQFNMGQPITQRENHDGIFIWANPRRMRERLNPDLTPEMIEQLRSIGYMN